ncbi:MAG TPA: UvrD-helicase domain-containing protein [Solirubrobacteraceae bacterium]|nr:UvrD-helicase domain-containing protein [Solirubrobacteraceae bacterium]
MSTAFDVTGPLPTGVTVLEASAGTGKTYTIAALAARYVADGVPLEQLLLVTFTRMATGELRDRVRERLVSAEEGLARSLAGAPPPRDEVVRLLCDGSRELVELRRRRLAHALADFDSATIATTHGFCQEVLGGLGVAGDVEPGVTFVEDIGDLVEEVVDDLYLRRFHWVAGRPDFGRAQALKIGRVAIDNPATPIEPRAAGPDTVAGMRRGLAEAVRRELDTRKRRLAVMTYDDLLTRLEKILTDPGGDVAVQRLRARFRVVLVDEFQDTDPVQWDIVRLAFGQGSTLVLIGDPKQAIYAFRGADVYAYLEAAKSAGASATLEVNWRSDQGLLEAYDALFGDARLGHAGIAYRSVRAAAANREPRLLGAPRPEPLRLRVVHRDDPTIEKTRYGYAGNDSSRRHIAQDLAGDLVALLSSGGRIERRAEDGAVLGHEPVRPGHIAVLVRTHRQAALVRDALDAVEIPAVINGAGSVFGSEPARDWLRLLEAIERPSAPARARAAALTPFLGWDAERVASAAEDEWEEVHRRLHEWARVLRVRGVAALLETITLIEGLPGRVLSLQDGERRLTDLRHLGQLLHAAAAAERLGATALTGWLRQRIAAAEQETGDEERSRRLESDAEAVQVLTIHRSKGLEFPIVYFPYLWEPTWLGREREEPVFFHDPANGDARTIDVGLDGRAFAEHVEQYVLEARGEDLRLAYVALTRARHQAVVWWAGSANARESALSRLLFARGEDGTIPAKGPATPSDLAAVTRLNELAATAPGRIAVERSTLEESRPWAGVAPGAAALDAAAFARELDLRWRRTSFSDITAGAYEARVASEPEEVLLSDEPDAAGPPGAAADGATANGAATAAAALADDALRGAPAVLTEMGVGVRVGTLVHRVMEATDFAAPDLRAELAAHVAEAQARRRVEIGDPEHVVEGLAAGIETPLGPLVGDLRLRDVARADRLDELAFELPLVGGDDPTGRVALEAIAAVLREHLGPGDPLGGYAARLADPALRESVRGFLTGSLDLVMRLPGGRFAIADHKTNWLAGPGEPLSAWHHRPSALAVEMEHAHYGLQALLYTVALHRYLRWRLRGYDPDEHIAGVLYLFLRGMTGPDVPRVGGAPCGVFAWKPPGALVTALSDVLDRGGAA